jgi:hypothetical protein
MYKKNNIAVLITMMLMATTAYAADNSIYIDQAGDNATITMTQDGASNYIRGVNATSNDSSAKLYGDGLGVTITQTGSGNTLGLGAQTGSAGGIPSNITYSVTGNNNTASIDMNNAGTTTSLSNTINVSQTGNNTNTDVSVKGSNNYFRSIQSGNANEISAVVNAASTYVTVNQTGGGGNQTSLQLSGDKGTVDIVTVGASNTIGISQSGGGVNGHYAKVDLTGSSNSVSILQSGTIDMTTNIKSAGNSNSFTIIQR